MKRNKSQPNTSRHEQFTVIRFVIANEQTLGNVLENSPRATDGRIWGQRTNKVFFFKHLYCSIIALQWCVSFCFIKKWISYTYTYIPISPPSRVSLPHSLSHPSRWSQSTFWLNKYISFPIFSSNVLLVFIPIFHFLMLSKYFLKYILYIFSSLHLWSHCLFPMP